MGQFNIDARFIADKIGVGHAATASFPVPTNSAICAAGIFAKLVSSPRDIVES
jgi:hypothetical protein